MSESIQHTMLVLGDDKRLLSSLQRKLRAHGCSIQSVSDASQAKKMLGMCKYDLALLDLDLPGGSGLEILTFLNSSMPHVLVLVLRNHGKTKDRVRVLDMGADDCVMKPFDFRELAARVLALMRRSRNGMPAVLRCADLEMDLVHHRITRAGREIHLSPRKYALLECLMLNKERIVTREEIRQYVWGYGFDTGTNIVDVYISYLRDAVDDGFPRPLILTVHGKGFLFQDS